MEKDYEKGYTRGANHKCNSEPGGVRLRADFRLHTRADREFSYAGDASYYFADDVDGLTNAGIRIGPVTTHNKFDLEEFKALRRTAKKQDIFGSPA